MSTAGSKPRLILRSLDPIKALFYSALINESIAEPITPAMIPEVNRTSTKGRFTARPLLLFLGWTATAIPAAAAVAMLVVQ